MLAEDREVPRRTWKQDRSARVMIVATRMIVNPKIGSFTSRFTAMDTTGAVGSFESPGSCNDHAGRR
jgi:hypothetical protein